MFCWIMFFYGNCRLFKMFTGMISSHKNRIYEDTCVQFYAMNEHRLWFTPYIRQRLLINWPWSVWICSRSSKLHNTCWSRAQATVGADPFRIARMLTHRVKWSVNTRILVFPRVDGGMGPTKSTTTTCHERPAYLQWRPMVAVGRPCLLAWQILLFWTWSRTSGSFRTKTFAAGGIWPPGWLQHEPACVSLRLPPIEGGMGRPLITESVSCQGDGLNLRDSTPSLSRLVIIPPSWAGIYPLPH